MPVIDPIPYRIGKATKWLYRCDWPGCTEEFYHGGNPSGPGYCPELHRRLNKIERTRQGRERLGKGIRVKGTENDKRLVTSKRDRTWKEHIPRCPVCGAEISVDKDCDCP